MIQTRDTLCFLYDFPVYFVPWVDDAFYEYKGFLCSRIFLAKRKDKGNINLNVMPFSLAIF